MAKEWLEYDAKAIALYPYDPSEPGHLQLIAGDYLEVMQRNGPWAFARCVSSSCSGKCPMNHLLIFDPRNPNQSFDLLTMEVCSFLHDLLTNYMKKGTDFVDFHDERQYEILDLIRKLQEKMPLLTPESRRQVSKTLDLMRQKLNYPVPLRLPNCNVVRTHDITKEILWKNQGMADSSGVAFKGTPNDSLYPVTLSFYVTISFPVKREVRICTRLVNVKSNPSTVVSAPADFLSSGTDEITLKFHNIHESMLSDLGLIIRVMSVQVFGEKNSEIDHGKKLWASEYLGTMAVAFGPTDCRKLKDGSVLEYDSVLYELPEGHQSDVSELIFSQQSGPLRQLTSLPRLSVKVQMVPVRGPAASGLGPWSVITMHYPPNFGPDFEADKLFVHILQYNHRAAIKRTRVVLRVLDVEKRQFLPAFERTTNPYEFASVVQKGQVPMPIDEIAQLDLGDEKSAKALVPSNCKLVFEVERTSKSRGVSHLIACALMPLTSSVGHIVASSPKQEVFTIPLLRPIKDGMTAMDYLRLPEVSMGTDSLTVKLHLVSSIFTSREDVYRIIHHASEPVNEFENGPFKSLTENPIGVPFMEKVFTALGEMMQISGMRNSVVNMLVTLIDSLETSSKNLFDVMFKHYIATAFTVDNKFLADLYSVMLDYIRDSLPFVASDLYEETRRQRCGICCKCLSYILALVSASMNLSKELGGVIDDTAFTKVVEDIFQGLKVLMRIPITDQEQIQILVAKSFALRSYPVFCDIINDSLSVDKALSLTKDFLESVRSDPGLEYQEKTTTKNRCRLYMSMATTSFFHHDGVRSALLPELLSDIDHLMGKDSFESQCLGYVVSFTFNVFLGMMKSSSSLSNDLEPLIFLIPKILAKSKRKDSMRGSFGHRSTLVQMNESESIKHQLVLLLLYFADISIVKQLFSNQGDKERVELFLTIIDAIRSLVRTSTDSYILFICPRTFTRVMTFALDVKVDESGLGEFIEMIADFYNEFTEIMQKYNEADKALYGRIYGVDLNSVALLLPRLLNRAPPEARFNTAVFVPLVDIYTHEGSAATRRSVSGALHVVLKADLYINKDLIRSEKALLELEIFTDLGSTRRELIVSAASMFADIQTEFASEKSNPVVQSFLSHMNAVVSVLSNFREERIIDGIVNTILPLVKEETESNESLFLYATIQLYHLHLSSKRDSKVEAAEALVAGASRLSWKDNTTVGAMSGFPRQVKCERKKAMLFKAAELFSESLFFERAYDALEEIRNGNLRHDPVILKKVAELEEKCCDNIVNVQRLDLQFFYGATFYGNVPPHLKDKTVIYRTGPSIRASNMMAYLSETYPNVKVAGAAPRDKDREVPNFAYAYMFVVKPAEDRHSKFDPFDTASERLNRYSSGHDLFYTENPVRIRRTDAKYNEMAEWYRRVAYFRTPYKLPGLCSQCISETLEEGELMSPIKCAIYDTQEKTMDLLRAAAPIWRSAVLGLKMSPEAVPSLNLLIQGIVNANVNGGTKVFRDLFLEGPLKDEEENLKNAEKLKTVLRDQSKAVHFALAIHAAVMLDKERALHDNWETGLQDTESSCVHLLGKIDPSEPLSFTTLPDPNIARQVRDKMLS